MGSITENISSASELRTVFAGKPYSDKYCKEFQVAVEHGSGRLMARQLPEGFTSFSRNSFTNERDMMFDSGRTLEVSNPEPVKAADPKYTDSRARRRYRKKSVNLWNSLTDSTDDINLQRNNRRLICRRSKNVSSICAEQFREEYYLLLHLET